jgi:predicted RNA methylase
VLQQCRHNRSLLTGGKPSKIKSDPKTSRITIGDAGAGSGALSMVADDVSITDLQTASKPATLSMVQMNVTLKWNFGISNN